MTLRRLGWPWRIAIASTLLSLTYGTLIALFTWEVDLLVYVDVGARHFTSPSLYTAPLGSSGLLFTYPPFAAMLFVPWERLFTIVQTEVIWTAVNLGCLFSVMLLTIRLLRPHMGRAEACRWAMTLMLPATFLDPVFLTIGFGQVNTFLMLLSLWDLTGPRKVFGRTLPLGIATGVAAAIKLTPLIFVPYLVLTGRSRGARNCLISFAACEAAAFAASPSASRSYWTKYIFESGRAGNLQFISNQNLTSALERFNHGPLTHVVLWPALAVVAVGGLLLARSARRSSELLGVLVAATTGLVISPITWTHHIVWVVPAILWLALARERPRWGAGLAVAGVLLFWSAPIWWVPNNNGHELHENAWQLVAGNSFFIAMALFICGVAAMLGLRARRRALVRSVSRDAGAARLQEAQAPV